MSWFHSPKGWKDLSDTDKAWMKTSLPFDTRLEYAITANNTAPLKYLLLNYKFPMECRVSAYVQAAEHGSLNALQLLVDRFRLDSGGTGEDDRDLSAKLFFTAAKNKNMEIWKFLWGKNGENKYGELNYERIIEIALMKDFLQGAGLLLEAARADYTGLFRHAVLNVIDGPSENLEFVLSYARRFNDVQDALRDGLILAARSGKIESARLLLGCGADPNGDSGLPFFWAAANNDRALADLLLEHGGDLALNGKDILIQLRAKSSSAPGIEWMEELVKSHQQAAQKKKARDDRYHLVDPESYSETQYLPHGLRLTMIFNFSKRQQTAIAEKIETGQLTMVVKGFDEILDPAVIAVARGKLQELGGVAPAEATSIQKSLPVAGGSAPIPKL